MKVKLIAALLVCSLSGCLPSKQVGRVATITTREVRHLEALQLLEANAGSGKKAQTSNRSETIDGAIENLLRSVPGGQVVRNVTIYHVNNKKYSVTGDVYGRR